MVNRDDWRLTNQEDYLLNVRLIRSKYDKGQLEHDHCEFCFQKFSEDGQNNSINAGYTTEDKYRWICDSCYEDFKGLFNWVLLNK